MLGLRSPIQFGQTTALQANPVQAAQTTGVPLDDRVRRHITVDAAHATHHRHGADVDELVDAQDAADHRAITDHDMAGHGHTVSNHDPVAQVAVVAEVAVGHQQIAIADAGQLPLMGGAVDGHAFANGVVVANHHLGGGTVVFEVLGFRTNGCARENAVALADADAAIEHHMGTDARPRTDRDLRSHHGVGTNVHAHIDLSLGIHHGGGVDSGAVPVHHGLSHGGNSVDQGEHQFTGADQLSVHRGLRLDFPEPLSLEGEQFASHHELIAGDDGPAETHAIDAREDKQALGQVWHLGDDQAPHLGHRLNDQDPRHQRATGEMALELGLVKGDVLDRHRPLARLVLNHPVHEGEGVTVGQETLDLLAGQNRGGWGGGGRQETQREETRAAAKEVCSPWEPRKANTWAKGSPAKARSPNRSSSLWRTGSSA